jgi:hypothetical protein
VDSDEQKEFVFTNNTLIVEINNTANSNTLGTFFTRPWILIKQSNTTVDQNGEYDFGGILPNNSKDITFNIENIGGANLNIISVDGKLVNLENSTEGYFSITQQPVAPVVSPGNRMNFVVRFSPKVIGNVSTTVHIKTDSQNVGDFYFFIKGNGRNYIIGDTGPAGGIIFYDKGVSSGGWRYLEAAPAETEFIAAWWGEDDVDLTGIETGVGTGKRNTEIIVEALSQTSVNHTAAQRCIGLVFDGFSDWFLPSINELDLIYKNLKEKGLGGFGDDGYWSSSQGSASYEAWRQIFFGGRQMIDNKRYGNYVRAVRDF